MVEQQENLMDAKKAIHKTHMCCPNFISNNGSTARKFALPRLLKLHFNK